MTAIQKAREALDEARKFIAAEYADASAEMYGEWLASEARPVFSKICIALAALDAETDGWRTMDNAPKDGTRIELWHQSGDVLAGGYSIHGCWRDYQPGVWSWRSDAGALIDAKYWRPVPVPPESRS